jgi:hypothetical protein
MNKLIIVSTVLALASSSAMAADFQFKDSNSQGSNVGVASSSGTGNGAVVGGNGTIEGQPLGSPGHEWATDQTTGPGSRADLVQQLQAQQGRGRDK